MGNFVCVCVCVQLVYKTVRALLKYAKPVHSVCGVAKLVVTYVAVVSYIHAEESGFLFYFYYLQTDERLKLSPDDLSVCSLYIIMRLLFTKDGVTVGT